MGNYGRLRPNRMARLRIIFYVALVLAAHINVSNSMMQERRPKGRQEKWGKARVSHPEVNSKAAVSQSEVQSKVRAVHPEIHSKVMASSQHLYKKLFRLNVYSNQLEQTGKGMSVKDCPSNCFCMLKTIGDQTGLAVTNCESDPIDALPKLFNSHRNITQLYLVSCHLTKLPREIVKLPLILVNLDVNEFTELPQELLELSKLEQLYLSDNMISELTQEIGGMRNLLGLNLTHNVLQFLPQSIYTLSQLQYLFLEYNELQSLHHSIGALSQLRLLDVTGNKLQSIPAEIGNLTQLEGLYLADNHLKAVPCEIGRLTKLAGLVLRSNEIMKLPNEITRLGKLQVINISDNPLGQVPALPMESLIELGCNNCSVEILPCELFDKGHLAGLEFINNAIRSFGCNKSNTYLALMDLSHNSLQELPCGFFLSRIQDFSVSFNEITILPKTCSFFGDIYLEKVHFDNNKLDILHFSSFCKARTHKIRQLSFERNRISTIDITDSSLSQCFQQNAIIDLHDNKLSTLDAWPLSLSEMISIKLDVSGNNLSQFINSEGDCPRAIQYGSVFRMRRNQIKHFMDVFHGWKVIVNTTEDFNTVLRNAYFDLGSNPLTCDCVDYEVYRYIQALRSEQYSNLECHKPLSLRGQNPRHIPLIQFVCDVGVDCPDGCTCTNIPHSQTINVTCLNYNQTDIPEIVPDLPHDNYGYQLMICNQGLTEITSRLYLKITTELLLSNNNIWAININSSSIFQKVKILNLGNNRLQRLPESVAGVTNGTAEEVRLGSNPWVCDCEAMVMKTWIIFNQHIVKDIDIICCHSPPHMLGVKVINIERSMVCPEENKTVVYVVATISSAVFIFIVCVYIADKLKFANWRLVGSDECDGEGKEFDVFMCACSEDADADYVENFLIPQLEKRDFKVLYHREHFHPGKPIHVNMSEALEKSKRTLVFFSNGFRNSGYSMFEFHSAYDLDIRNGTRRLITIKDRGLDMSKLEISERHYFQTHTYLNRDDAKFWRLLENVLPRKRLGAQVRLEGY